MNTKRLLATLFTIVLLAVMLTACSGSGDSAAPTPTSTPRPTATPTPTEIPKSPEQEDFETITRLFESADNTIAGTKDSAGALPAGTRFLLRIEGDHFVTNFETTDAGFQRRIWQTWIQDAGLSRANHPLQSETYQTDCKYGFITGVLDESGKINWTAGNFSEEVFAKLGEFGVEKDPEYLGRVEASKDLIGKWDGAFPLTMETLVDAYIDDNGEFGRDYYINFSNFLKRYGFSGSFNFAAHCSVLSEKELIFTMTVDMTSFFDAMRKAASTRDGMTKFLCVAGNVDERSLLASLKQQNIDVMTFGSSVIAQMEALYRESFNDIEEVCTYTLNNNVLHFESSLNVDDITYHPENQTMTYGDRNWKMTLKKQ